MSHLSEQTPGSIATQHKNPLLQLVFAALGFTTIFFLWLIQPGVEPEQRAFYHWSGDPKGLFIAIAVDMLLAWASLTLLLLVARIPGRVRVAIWSGLFLFMPWIVYQDFRLSRYQTPYHHYSSPLFFAALILTVICTVFWRPSFAEKFEHIITSASTVLIFAAMFGVFLFGKLAWFGWQGHLITEKIELHHEPGQATIEPHRIIWIIFDELSYEQLYGRRFTGLQLPAFDALAKQSTVFTDALPPAIYTQIAIPGLLAGQPFDQIRTSPNGQLSVQSSSSGKWHVFDPQNTVFRDALSADYSTGIAGWYNPYCRIMPQVLDHCFWIFRNHDTNGMISSGTASANVMNALKFFPCMVLTAAPTKLFSKFPRCRELFFYTDTPLPESHISDYEDLYAASQKLLRDRSVGFVLLHLPLPHPGGIYNRATGKLTTSSSTYIDNLALTDRCLAGLRETLEQTGQWDSSTVVIMGDHSWRTNQLWMSTSLWSAEEEKASNGGQYDPRPAYIVKLPGQTTPDRVDTIYHTVNTRKLFDQLLAHKINTPAELSAWAQSAH